MASNTKFSTPTLAGILIFLSMPAIPADLAKDSPGQGQAMGNLSASPAESRIKNRINTLINEAIKRWEQIDSREVEELIDRFSSTRLAAKDADSRPSITALESVFRIASSASAAAPSIASQLMDVSEKLVAAISEDREAEKRISATEVLQETYGLLINAREFRMAQEFAQRHGLEETSWVEDLTPVVPSRNARYLAFRDSGDEVVASLTEIDIGNGVWLVVEVHPDCAYSRRALDYIGRNADTLSGIDQKNVVWLVSQSSGQAVPSMMAWNNKNPGFKMVLSFEDKHWPTGISFLEFPVFNLVRNGEVVQKLQGWPGDHQGELLQEAIRGLVKQQ